MRMHQRLGDTTHEEADEEIPNEMKHVPSHIRWTCGEPRKSFLASAVMSRGNDEARISNVEGNLNNQIQHRMA